MPAVLRLARGMLGAGKLGCSLTAARPVNECMADTLKDAMGSTSNLKGRGWWSQNAALNGLNGHLGFGAFQTFFEPEMASDGLV